MEGIDAYDVLVAAARQQVGQLPPEDLPMLAAEWLAAGLDTPTLRELAGLHRDDRSAAGLWPDVLAELEVALPVPDPRRVLAPWAARRVLDGERGAGWLVQQLLYGIPVDDVDDLVSLLYGLDHCLEIIDRPYARRVQEIAGVLIEARSEAGRIVWLLARLDPREHVRPLPRLDRDRVLVEAALRTLKDDLRRITRRRWSIEPVGSEAWALSTPAGSTPLHLTTSVDPDALPPEIEHEQITREFVDEATSHVGAAVLESLASIGAEVRCRRHAAPLTICGGSWVCDADPPHDVAEVGALPRAEAELHVVA